MKGKNTGKVVVTATQQQRKINNYTTNNPLSLLTSSTPEKFVATFLIKKWEKILSGEFN